MRVPSRGAWASGDPLCARHRENRRQREGLQAVPGLATPFTKAQAQGVTCLESGGVEGWRGTVLGRWDLVGGPQGCCSLSQCQGLAVNGHSGRWRDPRSRLSVHGGRVCARVSVWCPCYKQPPRPSVLLSATHGTALGGGRAALRVILRWQGLWSFVLGHGDRGDGAPRAGQNALTLRAGAPCPPAGCRGLRSATRLFSASPPASGSLPGSPPPERGLWLSQPNGADHVFPIFLSCAVRHALEPGTKGE